MEEHYAEPPVGGTIDHILALLPSLVPSAQRVAWICVEQPGEVVNMSGADLAEAAGTSTTSVSRTSRALGFRSFLHMRLLLGRDLGAAVRRDRVQEPGTQGQLRELADRAADLVKNALVTVDAAALDAAADAIAAAPRLLIVGTGASHAVAQFAAVGFVTNGRPSEAPSDAVVQQLTASVLAPEDVCLAISSSGNNSLTLGVAAAAARAGATVVGVSSFARSPLADIASHMLVSGARYQTWDRGQLGATLVQLLLLSALQNAVAERLPETAERARTAVRSEVLGLVRDDAALEREDEESANVAE